MELEDKADINKLRINSRIKHLILNDYLPAWARILGTWNKRLNYFDCYAGPGKYLWKNELVDGSPIIAIKASSELLKSEKPNKPNEINLILVENNANQAKRLQCEIENISNKPINLHLAVKQDDSEKLVSKLLSDIENLAPSFFFIDPYEHPFSLELMNKIMKRNKTEIMVNFMYYQIIRDIPNPMKIERCLKLFNPDDPEMLDLEDKNRYNENKILGYLHKRIGAKYFIPFRVCFGPDEMVDSNKLKYLLIHYSNNFKAFNLMLDIMWKHSEEGNPLTVSDDNRRLFTLNDVSILKKELKKKYDGTGKQIPFNVLVEKNWAWYFIEKHFRGVLKELEKENMIEINRITSKRSGLSGDDVIIFRNN